MGWVLDYNFQSGRRGIRIIYTIPLNFSFQSIISKLHEIRSERRVLNGGLGVTPPKLVAVVVCPLKTNAGVY